MVTGDTNSNGGEGLSSCPVQSIYSVELFFIFPTGRLAVLRRRKKVRRLRRGRKEEKVSEPSFAVTREGKKILGEIRLSLKRFVENLIVAYYLLNCRYQWMLRLSGSNAIWKIVEWCVGRI